MANLYVKNTGSNTAPYDTWAKAATTIATATGAAVAGDTVYVSSTHTATGLAAQTLTLAGTASNPLRLISVNDAATPPTALATGGAETTAASAAYSIGPFGYVYGLNISSGAATNATGTVNLTAGAGAQALNYVSCVFTLNNTGSASKIALQQANFSAASRVACDQCTFALGNQAAQGVQIGGRVAISGGAVTGAAGYTTGIFQTQSAGRNTFAEIEGVDLSGVGAASNLVGSSTASMITRISNCRLPAAWTGEVFTGTRFVGQRVSVYNCDNADTNYRLRIEDYSGSIRDETTIVCTGGASDGVTPISWKMTSNADANEITVPLRSDPVAIWNTTIGTPITVTLETVTDNVTLTDAEAWIDVDYLGTTGLPLGLSISDKRATVLATPANQTASTAAWTTTGLTTPVKQKLAVTFTPQEVGFIYATVRLAKVSTTMYVDPKITVN